MLSIDRHGIQVPLTVYREGNSYRLIDGERRWRCAKKLNLQTVPVLVQDRPTELQNLILMYNIHALREQWDYYTIASKLERVISLFEQENGHQPNEIVLSELTGLTRGAIRRCQLLIELPSQYKTLLLRELSLPKSQQRLSEDFFLEMEKSLRAVINRIPEYGNRLEEIRGTLINKFRSGTISAVTDFRQLSKIATAIDGLGVAQRQAQRSLDRVFDEASDVSIRDAYNEAVQFEYVERRAVKSVESLMDFFDEVEREERRDELDDELVEALRRLHDIIGRLLES